MRGTEPIHSEFHSPATVTAAPSGYLNTAEVSARFFGGLSTQTVRNFVAEDGLPAHRVMRRLLQRDVNARNQFAPTQPFICDQ